MNNYYHPYVPTKTLIKKYLISKKKYMWKRKKHKLNRWKHTRWKRTLRTKRTLLSPRLERRLLRWKRKAFNLKKHKTFTRNQKTIARKHRIKIFTVYAYRWYRTRGRIVANHRFKAITGNKTLSYFARFKNNTNWNPVTLLHILDTHHPLVSVKMGFNLPTLLCYDKSFFVYKHQLGDWKRECFNSIF